MAVASEFHTNTYKLKNGSKIHILNNILSSADTNSMFDHFIKLPWNSTLHHDSVRPRRSTYWYGPNEYIYSGVHHTRNLVNDDIITNLLAVVNSIEDYNFDSVLFNRYVDGEGIPAHKDNEEALDSSHGILGVRFGSTRPIQFLDNDKNILKTFDIPQGNGYYMPPQFQENTYHEVPSESSTGTTITATFRKTSRSPQNAKLTELSDLLKSKDVDFDFSDELDLAKKLVSFTDTIVNIITKIDSVKGSPAFNTIKPFLNQQYAIIITNLFEKFNNQMNNISSDILKNTKNITMANVQINSLEDKHNDLETELSSAKKEISELKLKLDEESQYSRRLNLLVMGINEGDTPESRKAEKPTKLVLDVMKKCNSFPEEKIYNVIDRAHRLGAYKDGKKRPIIIRFLKYDDRQDFITSVINHNKSSSTNKFIIREHLVESRQLIFKECLGLRALKKINSVHSSDGIIQIKIGDKVVAKIKNIQEFKAFKNNHKL